MRKRILLFFIAIAVTACEKDSAMKELSGTDEAVADKTEESFFRQGKIAIKLSESYYEKLKEDISSKNMNTRSDEFNSVLKNLNVTSVEPMFDIDERFVERARRAGLHKWYIVTFDENTPLTRSEESFASLKGVEEVEYIPKISVCKKNNDPFFSRQWSLAPYGKNNNFNLNIDKVWDLYTGGSDKVIVAVMDEGVDLNHEDLKDNVLREGKGGSKTFVKNAQTLLPGDHGCHVAGIISAVNNNSEGICSVAGGNKENGVKGTKIMSCEIIRTIRKSNGEEEVMDAAIADSYRWAADNGAVISQNSWGYIADEDGDGKISRREYENYKHFKTPSYLKSAFKYFIDNAGCDAAGNQLPDSPMKGGLIIFAAGNEGLEYGYPAGEPEVLAVASVDKNNRKSDFSNYGNWVDMYAPGNDIYSCVKNNKYDYMSGTSMAAPHVTGVAALVLAYYGKQGFTNTMLRDCLLKGGNGSKISVPGAGVMLDALGAMVYMEKDFPSQKDFEVSVESNTIDFSAGISGTEKIVKHYLLASERKESLESFDADNIPQDVIYKEVESEDTTVTHFHEFLKVPKFDTDYYVSLVICNHNGKYSGKPVIKSVRTLKNNPPVITITQDKILLKHHETKNIPFTVTEPDKHSFTVKMIPETKGFNIYKIKDGSYELRIEAFLASPGKGSVTITAEDEYGEVTNVRSDYEIFPNTPPVQVKKIENIIISGENKQIFLTLDDYIKDPDGETLEADFKYDAHVLKISETGGKIQILSLKQGYSKVTMTVRDRESYVSCDFMVLVKPEESNFMVMSNPVTDFITLRTGAKLLPTELELISESGNSVFHDIVDTSGFDPYRLDVSGFPVGMYSLKIVYDGITEYKQIAKI